MSVKYGGMKKILDDRSHFIINASPHNSHKRCSIPNSYNLPVDDLVHDIKNKIVSYKFKVTSFILKSKIKL